jgi:hypothetical protein
MAWCYWFVDMDTLLMLYIAGMVIGAAAGMAAGNHCRSRDRGAAS